MTQNNNDLFFYVCPGRLEGANQGISFFSRDGTEIPAFFNEYLKVMGLLPPKQGRLELIWDGQKMKVRDLFSENDSFFYFDWIKQINYLKSRPPKTKEPFARALKIGKTSSIVDSTCGSGKDSLYIAALSALVNAECEIYAFERNPLLSLLLADAKRRALANPQCPGWVNRIHLVCGDYFSSGVELINFKTKPTVVYFDPMYNESFETGKKSKSRKEIDFIQRLFSDTGPYPNRGGGESEDFSRVCEHCLDSGIKRLLVKRAKKFRPIFYDQNDLKFRYEMSFSGSTTTYDLFVPKTI